MEKTIKFFSPKLKFFFILLTFMACNGRRHNSRIDQASALRAFRHSKNRAQIDTSSYTDEKWSTDTINYTNLDFENERIDDGGKMEDDVIEGGLPGQPFSRMKFKQYAGYINVDKLKGRSLFYYFAEAVHAPSSKPLILWLNGGPGCSSLGVGAMVEIGPFGVNPDGKTLYSRRFGWNKVANILFLESPAGVGFSYSNTTSDYDLSGDKRTAEDAYTFLVNWFRRYPHYKDRDFYIIGESYAGFYIPELADAIIKKNNEGDPTKVINLKGIMIGNGIMKDDTDDKGSNDYLWSHALISDETYKGLTEHCNNSNTSKYCDDLQQIVRKEVGNIDFYNIYGPVCTDAVIAKRSHSRGFDPCEGKYVKNYLNHPRVQQALHANITKLPYSWETCSIVIEQWKDSPSTMFPIYKRLISSGLRVFLYSGDVDAVVPVTSTRYSIDAMNLKVIKPWHFWTDETKEVAGYKVVYDGLMFATVRGAGHEVPRFQPHRSLALLNMFLANLH